MVRLMEGTTMNIKPFGLGSTVMASICQHTKVSERRAMVQLEAPDYDLEQVMETKMDYIVLTIVVYPSRTTQRLWSHGTSKHVNYAFRSFVVSSRDRRGRFRTPLVII